MKRNLIEVTYFNDRVGRAVYPGDQIVYAVRHGSWIELKVGEVIKVLKDEGHSYRPWDIQVKGEGQTRISHLEKPNCIVKVRSAREIELKVHHAEVESRPRLITFGQGEYDQ